MSLDIIPVPEEREWLGGALRELLEKSGADLFLRAPILRPAPEYFPDPWNGTLADVHRLTQRLMHQAGLGNIPFTISGFNADDNVWDRGTAGWYAGVTDGRCRFGVHLSQLKDPEGALGVMAHEVAHAWREHHGLVHDDRDIEEILTDLTTICLGFGIFTTNNADRYRSYGISRTTYWSATSTGYLPPPAMAWLLAVQAFSRGGDALEAGDDLEPNQRASFRAALHELGVNPSAIGALALPSPPIASRPYARIQVHEPSSRDIEEPEAAIAPRRNAGVFVHRVSRTGPGAMLIGLYLGAIVGIVVGWLLFRFENRPGVLTTIAICAFAGLLLMRRKRRLVCSDRDCVTVVTREMAVCPTCGGTLADTIDEHQLGRVRKEDLDRDSAAMAFEECDECEPEEPCAKHA